MKYEQGATAVIEFYKTERLPLLEKEITALTRSSAKTLDVARVTRLIAEYNQALDLVHGKNAPYIPHYVLENNDNAHKLRQFFPSIVQPKTQTDSDRFTDGPAKGLVKPKVVKDAAFEDQPLFDISFLTEQLHSLTSDVQNETYGASPDLPEIVLFDSQQMDKSDLDDLEEIYPTNNYEFDVEDDYYEEEDVESKLFLDNYSEVEIYYDESIPAGMLLIELYNPITEEIDLLYLPHIPMNFSIIISLMSDYIEIGGSVSLIFSHADKKNNLVLPINPSNPDKPVNPLLN